MKKIALTMPKMSMTMETGTLVAWEIAPGAPVRQGDVVAVVTTDKVDMDVESRIDGTLCDVLAQPGDVIPVGQPMGYIASLSEDLLGDLFKRPAQETDDTQALQPNPASSSPAQSPTPEPQPAPRKRVYAVPLARRLAREAGIDLSSISPSGPGRTIRARDVRDVLADAPQPTQQPKPTRERSRLFNERAQRVRQATAATLEASALIPQFCAYRELDLQVMANARKSSLRAISWTTIFMRAYALTLRDIPQLNAVWTGDGVEEHDEIVISIAVDTPTGLIVPIFKDVIDQRLPTLNTEIKNVVQAIRGGDVSSASFGQGTATLSNLGSMGVDRFNALLTPPQATALAMGSVRIVPRFQADGGISPRTVCEVGLSVDHRVADGADAARALERIQNYLDDPVLFLT